MRFAKYWVGSILVLATMAGHADTNSSALRKEDPPLPVQAIIEKFAAKESEFQGARERYIYRQTAKVEVLTLDGRRTGEEWLQVTDVLFDDKGKRIEKVVRAPVPTLQSIQMTPEDVYDLQNLYPFVLTTADIEKYNLAYRGKEKIDEIDTYVFDVIPKTIEKGQRYFEGRIWVDDRDHQIVKTFGKPVYEVTKKNRGYRFPKFETYRENIDGQYWFPTYSRADEVLQFETGNVRIREVVKYENYRRFEADVKFSDVQEVSDQKN
ncbi:MAG: hypothetical protein AB1898_15505 [Acidobacteriota bacterium]